MVGLGLTQAVNREMEEVSPGDGCPAHDRLKIGVRRLDANEPPL